MPHSHESSAVIFEKSQNTQIPSLFATGTTCKKQQEKKIKKPTQNSHTVFHFFFGYICYFSSSVLAMNILLFLKIPVL